MKKNRNLTAIIHQERDIFVAECPQIGTASQGYSIDEAMSNLKEATELFLEEFPVEASNPPFMTTFQIGR
jgi:predicted RNase H-like HicB family nuclease